MNLVNSCEGIRCQDQRNMKPKFFLQISDQQQSVVPAASTGLPHTARSAGGR